MFMLRKPVTLPGLLISSLLLSACSAPTAETSEPIAAQPAAANSLALSPVSAQIDSEYWRLLPENSPAERAAANSAGLWLVDAKGDTVAHLPGRFASLDLRSAQDGMILASVTTGIEQPLLVHYDSRQQRFSEPLRLPPSPYKIESLCLYHDDASNLLLFTIGEEGLGDQWLVASQTRLLDQAQHVRRLSLPPQSEFCAVDDDRHLLYVSEENVGIWAYGAHPEAELSREPVDLLQPFGSIKGAAGALSVSQGTLLATDPKARQLHVYQPADQGWSSLPAQALADMDEPEWLSSRTTTNGLQLLLIDDADGALYQAQLNDLPTPTAAQPALPVLLPLISTESVPSVGDAADDPAIWLHPEQPERSRILGTDKRAGLAVYDLNGQQLQFLPSGRLNNVDVRPGFNVDAELVDLAVASNRDHNSLHLFAIDRDSGELSELGQVETPLDEIYGLCMSQSPTGDIYAIANDKDGRFLQYRLSASAGQVQGELVRQFKLDSQPEGCVADDQRQRLFIGEEDVAVWALDARADASTELHKVIGVGGQVQADIEGLALYQHPDHPYLVISSQGNDSYVVLDAEPPYALRGAFRIGLNAELGIDGASETDGLEVTSSNLGGPWSQGLLVVQDGRKRMPENNQNYKYVPWQAVAELLKLP